MKSLIALALVALAAWFAWKHFQPLKLNGATVPEDRRVAFFSASDDISITDRLDSKYWTLILFVSPGSSQSQSVERTLEVAVRQRITTVRLAVIDVGSLETPAAQKLMLKELPSAWLFEGLAKRSEDLTEILAAMSK